MKTQWYYKNLVLTDISQKHAFREVLSLIYKKKYRTVTKRNLKKGLVSGI